MVTYDNGLGWIGSCCKFISEGIRCVGYSRVVANFADGVIFGGAICI